MANDRTDERTPESEREPGTEQKGRSERPDADKTEPIDGADSKRQHGESA